MSWVWPTKAEYQQEIPAWIRFDAWHYTSDINERNKNIETFWTGPDYVSMPLPTKIGTDLNMDYTTNSARIATDRNFSISSKNPLNPHLGTLYDPNKNVSPTNIRMPGRDFKEPPLSNNNLDYDSNKSFLDVIDTTWLGQSRRIYTFDINMICKSLSDSRTAASICNYMNAAALPVMETQKVDAVVGNQKAFHPSMWAIHVHGDNVDSNTATRMWLGEYPQLCVLQKVHGTRIGGDGNQIIGMRVDSSFDPILYNLKLIFVELEPVYRNAEDTVSRSRSQFFTES